MSRYRPPSPREAYEAGMIHTEQDLRAHVDSCRLDAKNFRRGAFWLAYVPGLFTAYAWAVVDGSGWTSWVPFAWIFITPVPSIVWARRQELRADDLEYYHQAALERRRKQQK